MVCANENRPADWLLVMRGGNYSSGEGGLNILALFHLVTGGAFRNNEGGEGYDLETQMKIDVCNPVTM